VEDGLLDAADEADIKEVIAIQVGQGVSQRGLTKTALAEAMHTSRTQVDRLLGPGNTSVSMHTRCRTAAVLAQDLRTEMVDRALEPTETGE
jgi:antitoxin HicB